ncbi:MAG: MBL fold metallo-hydrolase, partial [Candidatus Baldrarchaeota archaeon]
MAEKNNVKVKFLGGARRIGCSAILLQANGKNILLDYGATPGAHLDFPLPVPSKEIDAIILTHAHIDHSGAIPLLYTVANPPLITTPATLDLAELLIYDMMNVARDPLPFGRREVKRMKKNSILLNYKEEYKLGKNIKITLFNAGHIPGSSSVLLEINGVKIWYSGDINTIST